MIRQLAPAERPGFLEIRSHTARGGRFVHLKQCVGSEGHFMLSPSSSDDVHESENDTAPETRAGCEAYLANAGPVASRAGG